MLIRLEADGFKNLLGFQVDLGPFNCIAGQNGVGKSNIFDAIRFLSLLADRTIMEAALAVRGTDPDTGDLLDLFWTDGEKHVDRFRLAAEMLVEPDVVDDFDRPARATSTYLRYEVEIGYEQAAHEGSLGRLLLHSERLDYITQGGAAGRLRFPHSAKDFRRSVVFNRRRAKTGYISTQVAGDGQREILVSQDGGSAGPPKAHAATAPRTIVATSNTSTTPTILATRREMQSWRLLALEPSALRGADRFHSEPHIRANGSHLPAALYRLASEDENGGDPERLYARITTRLAELVAVDKIEIDVDQIRKVLTLQVRERGGVTLPARSLSDGTLRFLALCILSEDPEFRGLICMEEPENGIHPEKIDSMVHLLRDLAVDADRPLGRDNPLRQVIVATHSPSFVQLQDRRDLLFATEARMRGPFGKLTTALRCRPLKGTWRDREGQERAVSRGTILAYLTTPPGAQIVLPGAQPG